jgi:hypothetical protein
MSYEGFIIVLFVIFHSKCWYLFLIMPRVLALAMFAATFRSWFWIIIAAHWWAMLFWILRFVRSYTLDCIEYERIVFVYFQRTIFCISDQTTYNPREAIFEKCYNLVCSYIFIFCYMVCTFYLTIFVVQVNQSMILVLSYV